MDKKKLAKEIVNLIINELEGRAGFDEWWDEIVDSDKCDIIISLRDVVEFSLKDFTVTR